MTSDVPVTACTGKYESSGRIGSLHSALSPAFDLAVVVTPIAFTVLLAPAK